MKQIPLSVVREAYNVPDGAIEWAQVEVNIAKDNWYPAAYLKGHNAPLFRLLSDAKPLGMVEFIGNRGEWIETKSSGLALENTYRLHEDVEVYDDTIKPCCAYMCENFVPTYCPRCGK